MSQLFSGKDILAFGTAVFGHFEHKIEVFVLGLL